MNRATQFDADWYARRHASLASQVHEGRFRDLYQAYLKIGLAQGHDPNALFDESWYRNHHDDVARGISEGLFFSGFDHYVKVGAQEGRRPNGMLLDEDWYHDRYPAAAQYGSAYDHYLSEGAWWGCDPHSAFDERSYRERYPDVAQAIESGLWLSGYQHFLKEGHLEQRVPHVDYLEDLYLEWNPDVRETVESGQDESGYHHLISQGLKEGRKWREAAIEVAHREAATTIAELELEALLDSDGELSLPSADQPLVSIVIVLFNCAELTRGCLESLGKMTSVPIETILIDNLSTDRTGELLDRVRGAKIVRNDENVGFILGANQGAALATGRFLLFLNPDAELLPGSLEAAVERFSKTENVGAVGGRIVSLEGTLQEAGCHVSQIGTTGGYGNGDVPTSGAYTYHRPVDYVSGAFLMTPRSTFEELGGFDEIFIPAYYEDVDYCFRLREKGLDTYYEPGVVVMHYESASQPEGWWKKGIVNRNRKLFVERHQASLPSSPWLDSSSNSLASDRTSFRGRILIVDDCVPHPEMGSGAPRMKEIVLALVDAGWFVTLFTNRVVPQKRRDLPQHGLELITHLGFENLAPWWQTRAKVYDLVVVSRIHNLRVWLARPESDRSHAPLIFDTEALVQRSGQGSETLEENTTLAKQASMTWAVNQQDASVFAKRDLPVAVISHAVEPRRPTRGFDQRSGLLFVGRISEDGSPNVDGLRWLLEDVWPILADKEAEQGRTSPSLEVVGLTNDSVSFPDVPGVQFLGTVEDLAPLYDRARLFVAPARFAAGIPLKIIDAAANGLPSIATSILSEQLKWKDGVEIAATYDDPAAFADRLLQVYHSAQQWQELADACYERVVEDYSVEALRRNLELVVEQVIVDWRERGEVTKVGPTPEPFTDSVGSDRIPPSRPIPYPASSDMASYFPHDNHLPSQNEIAEARERGYKDAQSFAHELRIREVLGRESRLAELLEHSDIAEQLPRTSSPNVQLLEKKIRDQGLYISAIESSKPWRLIQKARRLVGRGW